MRQMRVAGSIFLTLVGASDEKKKRPFQSPVE
jgi:hypothetical protein